MYRSNTQPIYDRDLVFGWHIYIHIYIYIHMYGLSGVDFRMPNLPIAKIFRFGRVFFFFFSER